MRLSKDGLTRRRAEALSNPAIALKYDDLCRQWQVVHGNRQPGSAIRLLHGHRSEKGLHWFEFGSCVLAAAVHWQDVPGLQRAHKRTGLRNADRADITRRHEENVHLAYVPQHLSAERVSQIPYMTQRESIKFYGEDRVSSPGLSLLRIVVCAQRGDECAADLELARAAKHARLPRELLHVRVSGVHVAQEHYLRFAPSRCTAMLRRARIEDERRLFATNGKTGMT